jgi:hypothetical protein
MPSLAPFGQAVSEEKIFLTLANLPFFHHFLAHLTQRAM